MSTGKQYLRAADIAAFGQAPDCREDHPFHQVRRREARGHDRPRPPALPSS
jgi:hypothetical protein